MNNKNDINKCTQCGASLPYGRNVCEYCGSVYKTNSPAPEGVEPDMKGDITSGLDNVGDILEEMLEDVFDFPFIGGGANRHR